MAPENLGSHVIPLLHAAGHDVRVLSRTVRDGGAHTAYVAGDLKTGEGVDATVAGVGTIRHLAGSAKGDDVKARRLIEAAIQGGHRPHVTYISVVGANRVPVRSGLDRMMFGYIAAKRSAEVQFEESRLPWTSLRATKFHDLVHQMIRGTVRLPFMPVFDGVSFQPVDAGEVAARLVDLAIGAHDGGACSRPSRVCGAQAHPREHEAARCGGRRLPGGREPHRGACRGFEDVVGLPRQQGARPGRVLTDEPMMW